MAFRAQKQKKPLACFFYIQNPCSEPVWANGLQHWAFKTAVALVLFIMLLVGTIIVAAVPRITDNFHSLNGIEWYGQDFSPVARANQRFFIRWPVDRLCHLEMM